MKTTVNLDIVYDKDPVAGGEAIGYRIIFNYATKPRHIDFDLNNEELGEAVTIMIDLLASPEIEKGYKNDLFDRLGFS